MKIGLVAIATLAFATSAHAAPANTNPLAQDQAVLNLQGIDLSTPDGQQRLEIRIGQAARAVCGDRVSSLHLALEAKSQACQAAVAADVRSQIEARFAGVAKQSAVRTASIR